MGKALYRKYRSRSLDEIVGQEHVTALLKSAIEKDRIAHAYLFTGPRGVGKTSIARIMAYSINSLPYDDESSHLDIIEIDAASNNSVDDIRDLREKVQLAPVSAKKKVYIIDEVHMLSKSAFNALLKTLEEPPEHVVFILATTDLDKLPDTIISRTQRHTFRRATIEDLVRNMQSIATNENIAITDEALILIAEHSDGSYRDSVSMLDQLSNSISGDEMLTADMVETSLGLAPFTVVSELLENAQGGNIANVISILNTLENRGVQAKTITEQAIRYIRSRIHSSPDLLPLMNNLLDVFQSNLPREKLLVVLASHDRATEPDDSKIVHPAASTEPFVKTDPVPVDQQGSSIKKEKSSEDIAHDNSKKIQSKPKATKKLKNIAFDWQKFTEDVRANSVPLHSVLAKCGYTLSGLNLTIFTRNDFYKKKLNDPRSQSILYSALRNQSTEDWQLELIASVKPPEDSQSAAIAAMMGGGEEVVIDE